MNRQKLLEQHLSPTFYLSAVPALLYSNLVQILLVAPQIYPRAASSKSSRCCLLSSLSVAEQLPSPHHEVVAQYGLLRQAFQSLRIMSRSANQGEHSPVLSCTYLTFISVISASRLALSAPKSQKFARAIEINSTSSFEMKVPRWSARSRINKSRRLPHRRANRLALSY